MKYAHLLVIATITTSGAVHADQVFTENVIVDSQLLCVGTACVNGETQLNNRQGVKLHGLNVGILFDDNSGSGTGNPDTDWQISINDTLQFGMNKFSIEDVSSTTSPFTIEGGAQSNALYVRNAPGGEAFIGLGTAIPLAALHIQKSFRPTIRLQDTVASPQAWNLTGANTSFWISDATNNTVPFIIDEGAPDSSLGIHGSGNIRMGTDFAEGKLHTKGDGVQLVYFESGDGGPVQVRFRTDSENRRFLAVNNANEVKSQIIFLDERINFTGQTDSGANLWLSIGPNGILSQGGTCNVNPCDRTFDPDFFTVAPIEERAAYMWEHMHLPAVGPTTAGEPINLTEKTTGMLHELEVAHIYIEQLHGEIASLKADKAQQEARLTRVETLLSELHSAD